MMDKTAPAKSNISYKSSKSALWQAYKELQQKQTVVVPQVPPIELPLKMTKLPESDWKKELWEQVKKLERQLEEKQEEKNLVEEEINKAKKELDQLFGIKARAQTLAALEEKIVSAETSFARRQKQTDEEYRQEKNWRLARLEKEAAEREFELEMKRRRLEKELQEKEKEWRQKDKQWQEMEAQITAFPKQSAKEVEQAVREAEAKLKAEFGQERQLAEQEYQMQVKLLGQQVKNLLETIKSLENQNRNLGQQLSETQDRLKQLAVAALSANKTPEPAPRLEK